MALEQTELTLDKAIEWAERAVRLGYYSENTARLLRTAAEALEKILAEDEPRTTAHVRERAEQLLARLLNKSENLSHASAQTYMTRALRLIRDFETWSANPADFSPAKPPREESAKPKKKAGKENGRADTNPEEVDQTPSTHREHVLSLSGGKAMLRIPATISLDELQLLTLVLGNHCPEARMAQFEFLRRRSDGSDDQIAARSS